MNILKNVFLVFMIFASVALLGCNKTYLPWNRGIEQQQHNRSDASRVILQNDDDNNTALSPRRTTRTNPLEDFCLDNDEDVEAYRQYLIDFDYCWTQTSLSLGSCKSRMTLLKWFVEEYDSACK